MTNNPRHGRTTVLAVLAVAVSLLALSAVTAAPADAGCGTLRAGARGACVTQLQQRLIALHYDLGSASGVFESQTVHAVVAFHKVNGMSRTGVVTAATWAKLARPVVPKLRYARSGRALEVDIAKQVLYRGANGAVVKIYDVSTGRPSLPTPVRYGTPLRIWKKLLWGTTGYNDREHYVQYFNRPSLLALHGYGYVPAYPASHGCIRLVPASAARLYAATYVGEAVYTYR